MALKHQSAASQTKRNPNFEGTERRDPAVTPPNCGCRIKSPLLSIGLEVRQQSTQQRDPRTWSRDPTSTRRRRAGSDFPLKVIAGAAGSRRRRRCRVVVTVNCFDRTYFNGVGSKLAGIYIVLHMKELFYCGLQSRIIVNYILILVSKWPINGGIKSAAVRFVYGCFCPK